MSRRLELAGEPGPPEDCCFQVYVYFDRLSNCGEVNFRKECFCD